MQELAETVPYADRAATRGVIAAAVRGAMWWNVVFLVALVVDEVATLIVPAALAGAVDAALGHGGLGERIGVLATVLGFGVAAQAVSGLAGAGSSVRGTNLTRRRLLRHVFGLGLTAQQRFGIGDLTTRLASSTPVVGGFFPALVSVSISAVSSVVAVVALALIDWRLAITFVCGLPVALVLVRVLVRQATSLFTRYQEIQAAIASRLSDALVGIRTIWASGTVSRETERVLAPLPELSATGTAMWRLQGAVAWQFSVLLPLLELAVLVVAGFGVAAGRVSPGQVLAAVGYVALSLGFLDRIDSLLELSYARAGAGRVAEVLAVPPLAGSANASDGVGTSIGPGAVSLRGVTVRAGDSSVVLDRLDLEIPAGAEVAVVGRSGAGKTTLGALIGRLVDPDEGVVSLDGTPLSTLSSAVLRSSIAYAFERPVLVGDTVRDALGYGRAHASQTDVVAAAHIAHADGFVQRLPLGYDTLLRDAPMSGGEEQRLGLARAVVQGGRVLVLDDATSSLDTATEREVTRALAEAMTGRTRVVIAHRASTAARADLVAWLEDGRLRGLAPHIALWTDPDYRAVFDADLTESAEAVSAETIRAETVPAGAGSVSAEEVW